jgi:hypothetical protein
MSSSSTCSVWNFIIHGIESKIGLDRNRLGRANAWSEQRATREAVTRKLRWSAKSERCVMMVALIVTVVAISP